MKTSPLLMLATAVFQQAIAQQGRGRNAREYWRHRPAHKHHVNKNPTFITPAMRARSRKPSKATKKKYLQVGDSGEKDAFFARENVTLLKADECATAGLWARHTMMMPDDGKEDERIGGQEVAAGDLMRGPPWWWWEPAEPSCHEEWKFANRRSLCGAMRALNLTGLTFIGDSTSEMMAKSMMMLVLPGRTLHLRWKPQQIACGQREEVEEGEQSQPQQRGGGGDDGGGGDGGGGDVYAFTLRFLRNDYLTDKETVCPKGVCLEWRKQFVSGSTRNDKAATLWIVNTGAHFHSFRSFAATLGSFARAVAEKRQQQQQQQQREKQHPQNDDHSNHEQPLPVSPPRDLIFFRTTAAGHDDCENFSAPVATPPPTGRRHPSYSWQNFDRYNEYARAVLQETLDKDHRQREQQQQQQQQQQQGAGEGGQKVVDGVHLLDVVPMTRLRPDGHLQPPVDCLHYSLPGPPDWWNHLLVTQLWKLVSARRQPREFKEIR